MQVNLHIRRRNKSEPMLECIIHIIPIIWEVSLRIYDAIRRLMMISIPDHQEVTIRICLSLILTYTLTLGSFPNIIPPSQSVLIASIGAFTIVFPTLLFSIGAAVFPGIITTVIIALILSTALLAVAATAGTPAYICILFLSVGSFGLTLLKTTGW